MPFSVERPHSRVAGNASRRLCLIPMLFSVSRDQPLSCFPRGRVRNYSYTPATRPNLCLKARPFPLPLPSGGGGPAEGLCESVYALRKGRRTETVALVVWSVRRRAFPMCIPRPCRGSTRLEESPTTPALLASCCVASKRSFRIRPSETQPLPVCEVARRRQ